ncbi:hypothetical protein KHP62_12260 [Rhodobacteraceae bacterium NNCM2]|nr:hypothetical protein [Coraliihabitans acroporae]
MSGRLCAMDADPVEKPHRILRAQTPLQRLILPLATLVGGLMVYFLLFGFLVDPLAPDARPIDYVFLWETDGGGESARAADAAARYNQAVPSVLMSLAFIGALIIGFAMILPRYGIWAVVAGAVGVGAGALLGLGEQYNNPIRQMVADCMPGLANPRCPLDLAVLRAGGAGPFSQEVLGHIQFLTHWNSAISVAGVVLMGVCFLFISRSANRAELDPEHLRRRRLHLVTALPMAGLILVLSVATTHGFYHLSAALMAPVSAGPVAGLASAGTTYWGAAYSTVLIVVATPAVVSVFRDIQRGARLAVPDGTWEERQNWRKCHGLSLEIRDSVGVVVTMLTPVLTGPVLDAIKSIVPA